MRSARRRKTPPGRSIQACSGPLSTICCTASCRSCGRSAPCSFSTTRSKARPLPRRYSCALSRSRRSGSWLPSSMRREQDRQVAGDAVLPQLRLAAAVAAAPRPATRSRGSPYSSRPASRWKRIVSSTVRPRWRSSIWLCVLASASARATARRSWYFSIRRRAPASLSAKPVVNARRAVPPGGRRIDWRRLTIGSSTAPVVFESGAPRGERDRIGAACGRGR